MSVIQEKKGEKDQGEAWRVLSGEKVKNQSRKRGNCHEGGENLFLGLARGSDPSGRVSRRGACVMDVFYSSLQDRLSSKLCMYVNRVYSRFSLTKIQQSKE